MPYLDVEDYDDYIHLCQLFFAAHPDHRATSEARRADATMPGRYFFTPDMMRELSTWARQRQLITRKVAARLAEVAAQLSADPASIVPLTPRVLGTPPRLQPSVLSTDMFQWLKLAPPEVSPGDTVPVWTIGEALAILAALTAQPAMNEVERQRAHQLIAWLEEQVT